MKPSIVFLFVFLSVSFAHARARADVSLRNGNFFVTLLDLSYPGGIEPKIERVYNSKTDFTGMFGYSWGSAYEAGVFQDPDGSIVVTEYGGGATIRFTPKNLAKTDVEKTINGIMEAAKKLGVVSSAKSLDEYHKKLVDDYGFRAKAYSGFMAKGYLPKIQIAEGTQFTTTQYQYQYITKAKGGYVRVLEGGGIQKFNEAGKLVQITDRNKNYLNFTYDKNNRLIQMVDNQNRKMNLSYNSFGYVERVMGESGKHADFKYNDKGDLVYSRDADGVENTFKYTSDFMRNLTELGYPNQKNESGQPKKMVINYYGPDKYNSVKSVINPDGTQNEYEYLSDLKSPSYYAIRVVAKESGGGKISDSKYEYYYKKKAGGGNFTSKMVTTIDGDVTETEYDERLGFPSKVTTNGRVTTMDYDQKGRIVKKVTPFENTVLTYDQQSGKVAKVVKKLKTGTTRWSEFKYEAGSGNLVFAKNSDNKTVKLVYDTQGRIRALVDGSNHQITFKYNELSKPIEIADAKLGVVKFTYKNSGEVDKINSNGGANVASEIMRALQSLIDITAPAGVSMSL